MSISLAQGTQIAIAATYGTAATMSAITKAAEAVATLSAAHGISTGDIFEITSNWDRLNDRIGYAKAVATNDVTIEGMDTADTSLYPDGSGAGSVREILTWTNITQIAGVRSDTPQVEFADITTLADQTRKRIPTLDQAPTMNIDLFYDPSLSWVNTVLAVSDTNAKRAIKLTLPSGKLILAQGYVKMSRFPQLNVGEVIKNALTITFASIPTNH